MFLLDLSKIKPLLSLAVVPPWYHSHWRFLVNSLGSWWNWGSFIGWLEAKVHLSDLSGQTVHGHVSYSIVAIISAQLNQCCLLRAVSFGVMIAAMILPPVTSPAISLRGYRTTWKFTASNMEVLIPYISLRGRGELFTVMEAYHLVFSLSLFNLSVILGQRICKSFKMKAALWFCVCFNSSEAQ